MANNKVQLADGSVLIDITDTTAVAADVAAGKYFYGADGIKVEGTGVGNEWTSGIYQDTDGYIRVSPLGAAGGVVMDADGFLVLSETQSGADSYATITVSSSAPSGGNDGDVWIQSSTAFKKENGVWEQYTDLSSVFDSNAIYLRRSE